MCSCRELIIDVCLQGGDHKYILARGVITDICL